MEAKPAYTSTRKFWKESVSTLQLILALSLILWTLLVVNRAIQRAATAHNEQDLIRRVWHQQDSYLGNMNMQTAEAKAATLNVSSVDFSTLWTKNLIMHQGMFLEPDPINPGMLRNKTTLDVSARMDLDGNKDLLRRARCINTVNNGVTNYARVEPVKKFKGKACTIRFSYPPVLVQHLPAHDRNFSFNSCAIVGNAGRMLGEEAGKEIDRHEMVLRMNLAPTVGWERHVGSRTTFNMANHFHVSRLAWPGKHIKGHEGKEVRSGHEAMRLHLSDKNQSLLVFESTQYRAYYRLWEPLLKRYPSQRLAVLAPEFTTAASELWWILLDLLQAQGTNTGIKRRSDGTCAKHRDGSFAHTTAEDSEANTCARPLSGWYAIAFSCRVCKTIDVYGFNTYTKPKSTLSNSGSNSTEKEWPYHYYDSVEGETGTHNFGITIKVLEALGEHIHLTLH